MSEIKTGYTTMPAEWMEDYVDSLQKHIETINIAGNKLGVPVNQLNHHDDSKYSPEEFPYYARQFHGDKGDPTGFAYAWLHHCHENKHHWQHYVYPAGYQVKGADIQNGALKMPEKYTLEMIADWLASSFCYTGSWNMGEWLSRNLGEIILHPKTADFVYAILVEIDNGKIYV